MLFHAAGPEPAADILTLDGTALNITRDTESPRHRLDIRVYRKASSSRVEWQRANEQSAAGAMPTADVRLLQKPT